MANQARFLLALAVSAAWPCVADEIRVKAIDPIGETTWQLQQDGVAVRGAGREQFIALPDWTWVGAPHACPPALAAGPSGEILVTSNVVASVWEVDPNTRRVTMHELELDSDRDKDVGFSTLRYSPDERAWIAFSAMQGSIWRIDPALTRAKKIAFNPEWRTSCAIN